MQFDGLAFDNFEEGLRFESVEFSIDEQEARDFNTCVRVDASMIGSCCPQQIEAINPVLVANFHVMHRALSWPTGVLHAREEIRCSAPVFIDEPLRAETAVKSKALRDCAVISVIVDVGQRS